MRALRVRLTSNVPSEASFCGAFRDPTICGPRVRPPCKISEAARENDTSSDASCEVPWNDLEEYNEGGETARTAVSSCCVLQCERFPRLSHDAIPYAAVGYSSSPLPRGKSSARHKDGITRPSAEHEHYITLHPKISRAIFWWRLLNVEPWILWNCEIVKFCSSGIVELGNYGIRGVWTTLGELQAAGGLTARPGLVVSHRAHSKIPSLRHRPSARCLPTSLLRHPSPPGGQENHGLCTERNKWNGESAFPEG